MVNDTYRSKLKFALLIIAIILSWYAGKYIPLDTGRIEHSLQRFPLILSGLFFVLLYVVVTFFVWFSKDLFYVAAAVLFGGFVSAVLVCIAEAVNAVILFSLARSLGRGFVESRLKGKYSTLDKKLGRVSFIWLFIFRATPLIPYRFLDIAAGLTRMSFKRYMAAVVFGSPFKIFWLQFILAGVGKGIFGDPALLVEYFLAHKALLIFSLIYPLLVILVAFKLKQKH